MRQSLYFAVLAAIAVPACGSATLIDFEGPVEGPLTPSYYESVGARIEGTYVFHVPNFSWASARSGLQGICPISDNDHFGTNWASIVSDHGITPSGSGGATSDVFFVDPNTLTERAITDFSIGFGYDSDGGEQRQAVIIEAFDASGNRILDVVKPDLYYDGYESFSAPGAVRLRLTQNGYVGFDDLSFTPVPEPTSLIAITTGGLGLIAKRRRNRIN